MISLNALSKAYGGKKAVESLTLDVTPGRVTGFLGPNGAGKSTTMRLILGLDAADGGTALVNGRAYRELDYPLRTVGAHICANAGHPGQTPRAFLRVLARSNRIALSRVSEVLHEAGLDAVAGKRIGGFSLGMRQRLGIAAALLGEPQILVLDEPMNGLDAEGISWIRRLMREHADAGGTVFISSHLMSEVQQVADHLVIIGRGRLIRQASTSVLLEEFAQPVITVRAPHAAALAEMCAGNGLEVTRWGPDQLRVTGGTLERVGALAYASGIELHELSSAHESLENVYRQLTRQAVEYGTELEEAVGLK